ncbi:MAG: ion transporter [Bacteroidetes bacterium]|nr:MAG: ion transporter [Bacteroidota bacterium]
MENHRERIGIWIESDKIQTIIVSIIVFNAIMLGLQTSNYLESNFGQVFDVLDIIIPALFLIELLIKLYAFDYKFFKSNWNIFDFIIVVICLLPESGPLRVLRTLRILRVLRLIRKLPRLRMLVEAVLDSLPSLNWVSLLLLLVFYIYGLIGTLIFGPLFDEWFGTLGKSMYSLFQVMTLESWSMGIARPVIKEFPYAWIYFLTFIMLATYTSINIFIAIMVNTMQNLATAKEDQHLESEETEAEKFFSMPKKEDEILSILKDIQKRLEKIEEKK